MLGGRSTLPPRRPPDSLFGGPGAFVVGRLAEARGGDGYAPAFRAIVLLALTWPLLGGCAPYRIGHEKFSSSTAALRRQAELDVDILSQIQPVSSPVARSASILLPSDVELRRNYIQRRDHDLTNMSGSWSVSLKGASWLAGGVPGALTFALTASAKHFQLVSDAIRKRQLFDSLSVAFHDGNPGTYSIGQHDFLAFVDVDGWFVRGKGASQPRPVALDESKPASFSTIGAFLEALQREIVELRAR